MTDSKTPSRPKYKRCGKCLIWKTEDKFCKRGNKRSDELASYCRRCFYDYLDQRAVSPQRKATMKLWQQNNLQKGRDRAKRMREKYPDHMKARRSVRTAISNGTLKREPCAFCFSPKSHAHHADYSRPLYVMWLCMNCHNKLHKYERMQKEAKP